MSLLSRLLSKLRRTEKPILWPNGSTWCALKNEESFRTTDGPRYLWTIPCGQLELPSGRLVACDPFAALRPNDNAFVQTHKGRFPVFVTLADVSPAQDRSHIREAYASIVFSAENEAYRKTIPLARAGERRPETKDGEFVGFGVDAGTACFVDDCVIGRCMPDPMTWHEEVFDNQKPDSWFHRMDDPNHIRPGIANIILPLAQNGENLILFHSGWGDGVYPVVASFDSADRLVAMHIDFFVI